MFSADKYLSHGDFIYIFVPPVVDGVPQWIDIYTGIL